MIIFADVDPTSNPLNDFLKQNGIWIAVGFASLVLIAVLILFFISLKKRKENIVPTKNDVIDVASIVSYLGGKENIISFTHTGSRLSLVLKDYSLVNEKSLKENEISLIMMSNKITLISKGDLIKQLLINLGSSES